MDSQPSHNTNNITTEQIKKLSMNLPLAFHNAVKSRAAKQGSSLTQYIMKAIYEQMRKDHE